MKIMENEFHLKNYRINGRKIFRKLKAILNERVINERDHTLAHLHFKIHNTNRILFSLYKVLRFTK